MSYDNPSIKNIENKISVLEEKIDTIICLLETKLQNIHQINEECSKMSNHIDFIEKVYENVKNPLGYIVSNVKYYIGNNEQHYSLEDKE